VAVSCLSKAGEALGHGDGCGVFWEQWWKLWQETELCFRKRNSVSHFVSPSLTSQQETEPLFPGIMAGNRTLFPVTKMILGGSNTLGGGVLDGVLDWTLVGWLASWISGWRACRTEGRSIGCRLGHGLRGLQLLATTMSSLSLSSARRWNGLLLRMWGWWTNGICRMTFGAVVLLDVVATLSGGVAATL
jgi:hypothetical protein